MITDALLRLDTWLERYSRPRPLNAILVLGMSLILISFGITGYLLNNTYFNPDSWSYYELARTVFSGDFYAFNTHRGYFAETHSASFPPGYPVVLALAQLVVGVSPLVAVWLNIVVAALTWGLGIRLTMRLGVPAFAALALFTALVLWPFYLDELFAGRSMPLALLWLLLALGAYLRTRPLAGGLFLGLAALTRFDYTGGVLLFIVGIGILDRDARRQIGWWLAGLLIGMAPWIIYSWVHFGQFWASSNSAVALSALPITDLYFPARPATTLFDSPALWFGRVFGNIPELTRAVLDAAFFFPPLFALLMASVWAFRGVQRARAYRTGLVLLMIAASLAPYVLTGYFGRRYFSLCLFAWSLALALLFTPSARPLMHGFLAAALAASLGGYVTWSWLSYNHIQGRDFNSLGYHLSLSWLGYRITQERDLEQEVTFLNALHECHLKQPEHTLIFSRYLSRFTARYGAITGMKAAYIPSNFIRMSEVEKQAYFAYIGPYRLIEDSFYPHGCPNHDQP